jgi:hypothetical protein
LIKILGKNRITNFFLAKLTRITHRASPIKQQIRTKLTTPARPFPSPVHANINEGVLKNLASKQLELINFLKEDHPPWRDWW